jgi:hypothetical protein
VRLVALLAGEQSPRWRLAGAGLSRSSGPHLARGQVLEKARGTVNPTGCPERWIGIGSRLSTAEGGTGSQANGAVRFWLEFGLRFTRFRTSATPGTYRGSRTGKRAQEGAVGGKGLTRGGEGRSVLVEGGLGQCCRAPGASVDGAHGR